MGIDQGESCCAREVFIGHAENTTVDKLTPHANYGMGSGEMHGSICKSVMAEIKVKFDINEGQDSERGVVGYRRVQWWQEDESKALNFGEYKDSLADDRVRLVRAGFLSSEDREDHMCDNPLAKVQQPVSHVVLEIARVASSDAQVMDGSYGRNRVLLLSLVGTSGGMDGVDQSHEVLLALKGDLIAKKDIPELWICKSWLGNPQVCQKARWRASWLCLCLPWASSCSRSCRFEACNPKWKKRPVGRRATCGRTV